MAQMRSRFISSGFQILKPLPPFHQIITHKIICLISDFRGFPLMANTKKSDSVKGLCTPKNNKKIAAIDCLVNSDDVDDDSPLRPIFCLKRKSAIKEFDDREDCFILDFNPDEDTLDLSVENRRMNNLQDSPDIFLISEKGQVACRDYPHSRHLCVKHPFEKTSHESYCKLCYCFVCDVAAPCKSWSGHCHAIDNEGWKVARKKLKKG